MNLTQRKKAYIHINELNRREKGSADEQFTDAKNIFSTNPKEIQKGFILTELNELLLYNKLHRNMERRRWRLGKEALETWKGGAGDLEINKTGNYKFQI